MHSVYRSRGRIFFEVSCALAVAVCLAGAWKQTGASALLAAAAVAALFGIINAFDMLQRRPARTDEPQRIDFETVEQAELPVRPDPAVETRVVELPLATGHEEAEPAAAPLPQAIRDGQAKSRRKSSGRRAGAAEKTKVAETAPVAQVAEVETVEAELAMPVEDEQEFAGLLSAEEATHAHIEPLFEPEPFARMPRRAFGRRGQL